MTEAATLAAIDGLIRRGEFIGAYDRAEAALAAGLDHPRLRYLGVLALARAGATAKAAAQYHAFALNRAGDVDSLALWARILKDVALAAPPALRTRRLERAARAYLRVFRRTCDPFPAINAATLLVLAGRTSAAQDLAAALVAMPAIAAPADYYAAATRAEALIVLRRWEEAAEALTGARSLAGEDVGALSTTRRQLATLLAVWPADAAPARDLLARLRLPRVLHYSLREVAPEREAELARAVAARLGADEVGFGVGALWTTGALVAAEQVLAHGAELHLVLPFSVPDYLAEAARTRPAPEVERRRRCVAAAASVVTATADGDYPDPALVAYAAAVADGLARTRARVLATDCVAFSEDGGELAEGWDAPEPDAAADPSPVGEGRVAPQARTEVGIARPGLTPPRSASADSPSPAGEGSVVRPWRELYSPEAPTSGAPIREIRALLFADVYRFSSTIPESRMPDFWAGFMGEIAAIVEAAGASVLYRNTWGDALFLVLAGIEDAAEIALSLQERVASFRARQPSGPELRIGLHHGPVFRGHDPVRGVATYFGTQVSRAARVEPVAPPGAVYVTEPFAAILAATGTDAFETGYVGVVPLPKRYGEHRMYRLARRWPTVAAPAQPASSGTGTGPTSPDPLP